jgi:hypothetical protein
MATYTTIHLPASIPTPNGVGIWRRKRRGVQEDHGPNREEQAERPEAMSGDGDTGNRPHPAAIAGIGSDEAMRRVQVSVEALRRTGITTAEALADRRIVTATPPEPDR